MEIIFLINGIVSLLLGVFGKKFLNICFCLFVFFFSMILFGSFEAELIVAIIGSAVISVVAFVLREFLVIVFIIVCCIAGSFLFSTILAENFELTNDIKLIIMLITFIITLIISMKLRRMMLILSTSFTGATGVVSSVRIATNLQSFDLNNFNSFEELFNEIFIGFQNALLFTAMLFVVFVFIQFNISNKKDNKNITEESELK